MQMSLIATVFGGVSFALLQESGAVHCDEITRGRMVAARAALEETRLTSKAGRAKLEYAFDKFPSRKVPPERISLFGKVIWSNGKVKYELRERADPPQLYSFVIRDPHKMVHARCSVANIYSFDIEPPSSDVARLFKEPETLCAYADPAVFFGKIYEYLWSSNGIRTVTSSEDAATIKFVVEREGASQGHSPKQEFTFLRGRGLLPSAVVHYYRDGSRLEKGFEGQTDWQPAQGRWVPAKLNITTYTATKGKYLTSVSLSDVRIEESISDTEFALATMPVPSGTVGRDRRTTVPKKLVFSEGNLREWDRNVAAQERRAASDNSGEEGRADSRAAQAAQQARRNYYYRLCAGILVTLSVSAAIGGVMLRRRVARD